MNDQEKRNLELEKANYEEPQMSEKALEKMKASIAQAKAENAEERETAEAAESAEATETSKKVVRLAAWKRVTLGFAAAFALLIILPNSSATIAHAMESVPGFGKIVSVITFRDYTYDDGKSTADVHVGEVGVDDTATADDSVKDAAKKSTEEINAEIAEITDKFVDEFKENLSDEGYENIIVKSEVVNTTDDYFTLKLITYYGAGSGSEWNTYYTIDLTTGERLELKDLFKDGADYKTPISKNIQSQMKKQMAEDPNVTYWIDGEMEEWDFESISDETQFYINEKGKLVISFDEGDVAPMYMGVVTFTIPDSVIADIRK